MHGYFNDEERVNTQTEEERQKDKEALTNIGKLFGYSAEDMEAILNR